MASNGMSAGDSTTIIISGSAYNIMCGLVSGELIQRFDAGNKERIL